MGAQTGRAHVQSLAAWLAALSAGDPCPWCGVRLETGGRAGRIMSRAATATEDRVGRGALVCPECGCEVAMVDEAGEAERRMLHHAA